MRKVALLLAGLIVGASVWFHFSTEAKYREEIARLERERDHEKAKCSMPLISRLGAAAISLRNAGVEPERAAKPGRTAVDAQAGAVDAGEEEAKDSDLVSGWHAKASEMMDDLRRRAGLTPDQEAALQSASAEMNKHLGEDIDRAKELGEEASSREVVEIGLDALTSIKKADNAFRSALSPQQREILDRERFDILSQFDPLLLIRLSQPATL